MKNKEIAAKFEAIAAMMELLEENAFRVISYRKAARAVEGLAEDIEVVCREGRATEIAGIGESTAQKIEEYCKTGKITRYEELAAKLPPHLPDLLTLPGMGPKTAAKLWKEADITSIDDLKACIEKDRAKLEALAGLGEKKVQQMAESLAFVQGSGGRTRLGDATRIAGELMEYLAKTIGPARMCAAGSCAEGARPSAILTFCARRLSFAGRRSSRPSATRRRRRACWPPGRPRAA